MRNQKGTILIYEIIVIFIFSTVMLAVLGTAMQQFRIIRSSVNKEEALQIAEAGVNYYQWHLAHFTADYQDGTSGAGPYVHTYKDADTQTDVGQYSLVITPPVTGSTVVTITSTGWTYANPNTKRTVVTRYGVPSLAKYAFLTNSAVWIGSTESVSGQMHSNNGIRFDGTGNAPIQSAKNTYNCPSWSGNPCPATENGIWGSAPQTTKNFWTYPVPAVDFTSITSNFANIKTAAQTAGIYLAPSNAQGYSLVFNNDGTVSIYKVTQLKSTPTGYDVNGNARNEDVDYKTRVLLSTPAIPANGLIYIEDTVWVEGTVKGRALVAAARLPYSSATAPNIIIPNNIVYAAKDGTNSLGLMAQKDLLISYLAPVNLEIDAALIAQNGSVQHFDWAGDVKGTITIYGSIMSYGTWTWSWVDGSGNTISGYATTNTTYDSNLLYAPPPSFPLSSAGYQQISWASN